MQGFIPFSVYLHHFNLHFDFIDHFYFIDWQRVNVIESKEENKQRTKECI